MTDRPVSSCLHYTRVPYVWDATDVVVLQPPVRRSGISDPYPSRLNGRALIPQGDNMKIHPWVPKYDKSILVAYPC